MRVYPSFNFYNQDDFYDIKITWIFLSLCTISRSINVQGQKKNSIVFFFFFSKWVIHQNDKNIYICIHTHANSKDSNPKIWSNQHVYVKIRYKWDKKLKYGNWTYAGFIWISSCRSYKKNKISHFTSTMVPWNVLTFLSGQKSTIFMVFSARHT